MTQGDQNAITAAANANPQLQIGASGYNVAMDINRDGVIDLLDVFAFVAQANRPALAAGQISDPAGPDNLIGYDGYVFNMENMLYTVRFRHYDPQLGRWVQRDPAVYVNSSNLYEYAISQPLNRRDPSGLDIWIENTKSVAGFHKRICVDIWNAKCTKKAGKFCITFGQDINGASSGGMSESGGSGASQNGGSSDSDSSGEGSSCSNEEETCPTEGVKPLPPDMPFPIDGPDADGDGIIYLNNVLPATKISRYTKTSCAKDRQIQKYLMSLVNQKANYSLVGQNCRNFSNNTLAGR